MPFRQYPPLWLEKHAEREGELCRCFWTRGMVPAEWMEVLAVWREEEVDPCVEHTLSRTHLEKWSSPTCHAVDLQFKRAVVRSRVAVVAPGAVIAQPP